MRPELDLNLPYVDMDALIEDDKANEAIINDDLTDFRVKHGLITKVRYWTDLPPDIKANGNDCTENERNRLLRGTENILTIVQRAMANYDEKKFRKWFGADNDKQNDIMVKTRIRNTFHFMKDGFEQKWNVVCCKNQKGTCSHCGGRVLAYVMGTSAANGTKMS